MLYLSIVVSLIGVLLLLSLIFLTYQSILLNKGTIFLNELKLHTRLLKVAEFEKITVVYKPQYELINKDGHELSTSILYMVNPKTKLLDDTKGVQISISNVFKDNPWILAEALGNYYALRDYGDFSSNVKFREAKKIVLKSLNYFERLSLSIQLDVYLEDIK